MNSRAITLIACVIAVAGSLAGQRSDVDIRTEVERRIRPGLVSGYSITVTVQNGTVTLEGSVPILAHKLSAINMARRTIGVRDVIDEITVVPSVRRSDDEITVEARALLRRNLGSTDARSISIVTHNGAVTLTGTLENSYTKELCSGLVSTIVGVLDIANKIVVRPSQRRTDAEIFEDITSRYAKNPLVPAAQISVTVTGGVVTLTGVVDSFVQVEQAESVARFTPGVIDVSNNLYVRPGA
ncbi:MAG: BON domain-containing protein [Armatimonadota bacterium]